ncbi:MAG: VanZ family protein [Eubacterium sp.]
MRQEKIKTAVCWILTAVCMGVIFWLSSRTADESSAQSGSILDWLTKIFGENVFTDFIVRKTAHCLEYTGLSLLFNIALWQTSKKKQFFYATLFTSLYAVTDEIHQLFVDGRACKITDWAIDTAGAVIGTIAFAVIFTIIIAVIEKRKLCQYKEK